MDGYKGLNNVDFSARDNQGSSRLHHHSKAGGQELINCLIQPGNSLTIKKKQETLNIGYRTGTGLAFLLPFVLPSPL